MIRNATLSDSGIFQVFAKNNEAEVSDAILVSVKGKILKKETSL